jgi:site-specific recombinase XerD
MPASQKNQPPALSYYPAELCENKEWYVKYYVFNPFTGKLHIKKIKLNRIAGIAARRKAGRRLAAEVNARLSEGWNPFVEQQKGKGFLLLNEAISTYLAVMEKEHEYNTMRSYQSFCKRLQYWLCEVYHAPNLRAYELGIECAQSFMLWVRQLPKVSPRSYNNHLAFYRTLSTWFCDFGYLAANPFLQVQMLPKKMTKKRRRALAMDELRALVNFLQGENPRYLAACMLTYYCFLRPDDLRHLRKASFDLARHTICVRAEDTKNDHTSYKTIPLALEPYLAPLRIAEADSEGYLFSNRRTFAPGTKMLDSREIARYWDTVVRHALGWGGDLQFYSLKDSGITNLLADGVGANYVQGQADHSSLEVTNVYVARQTPEGHELIRERARAIV